jgi:hypothetical protein
VIRRLDLFAAIAVVSVYTARVWAFPFVADDAYISFRYARHFAEGLGLVWNPGERVEGYTNFLWVLVLGAGATLGFDPEIVARFLGFLAGLGVLLALAAFGARRLGWQDPWIWAAPGLLVAMRHFPTWANGGLETMTFALLVTAGLVRFVVERERGWLPWASSFLLSLATLTRPDGLLFLGVAAVALLWETARQPGRLRAWLAFAAPLSMVAGHVAFRWVYYGDLVPNVFYAKALGAHWAQGITYFGQFHRDSGLAWFVVPALLGAGFRRERADLVFAAAIVLYVVYLLRVGGDFYEFRMLVPVLPLAAWLATDLPRSLPVKESQRRPVSVAVLALAAIVTNVASAGTADRFVRNGIASVRSMRIYSRDRVEQGELLAGLVARDALPADLRIATAGAGALPYVSRLYTVDVLGLNDESVARQGEVSGSRRLGHQKHAWRGLLHTRGVDMLDITGRFVFTGRPTAMVVARAERRLAHYNATPGGVALRLHCRVVPDGFLIFGSTLPQAMIDRRFAHLPACPGAWLVPQSTDKATSAGIEPPIDTPTGTINRSPDTANQPWMPPGACHRQTSSPV